MGLIVVGVVILKKRNINWKKLIAQNSWIWLLLLFQMSSVLWSDFFFVSLKRWVKALGNLVMALVILTEQDPDAAFGVTLRRLAFLLLPPSILFIKYYPDWGRVYHMGMPLFTGVASQKNGLGQICLIAGIYFFWRLVTRRRAQENHVRWLVGSHLIVLAMAGWLLYKSNSATSLVCIMVAVCLLLLSRLPVIARVPGRIITCMAVIVSILGVLESTLHVSQLAISSLGRDPTLTTRVPMWYGLIGMAKNPLIGSGYESFWLGKRLEILWASYGQLIQAHNGYLEVYLNYGLVGLALVIVGMLGGLQKLRKQFIMGQTDAILKLTFLVVIIIYNWTEATFYGVSNIWLLLYVAIVQIPTKTETVLKEQTNKDSLILA